MAISLTRDRDGEARRRCSCRIEEVSGEKYYNATRAREVTFGTLAGDTVGRATLDSKHEFAGWYLCKATHDNSGKLKIASRIGQNAL
jgi:hypothetical protein